VHACHIGCIVQVMVSESGAGSCSHAIMESGMLSEIHGRDRLTRFLAALRGRFELDLPVVVEPSLDTKALRMHYIHHLVH
jgi:tRNA1(Val) A37 N6-methylase TrmN6